MIYLKKVKDDDFCRSTKRGICYFYQKRQGSKCTDQTRKGKKCDQDSMFVIATPKEIEKYKEGIK
jgi:hypothetical protein